MNSAKIPPITKQLLSRLTHHVRNPFNGIIGFTDLLNNHFSGLSDEDKLNYIKIVHQLSKKALLRSENLSWWLKFYTGNLTPVMQSVDVCDLIREELSNFNAEFAKQHLDLLEEYTHSAIVQTDKVMLQNIVKNILLNIVEFTPVGEEVNITSIKNNGNLEVCFTNVYTESVSDETLAFIASSITEKTQIEAMPDNPGLWTISTLCQVLGIQLSITFESGKANIRLIFNL